MSFYSIWISRFHYQTLLIRKQGKDDQVNYSNELSNTLHDDCSTYFQLTPEENYMACCVGFNSEEAVAMFKVANTLEMTGQEYVWIAARDVLYVAVNNPFSTKGRLALSSYPIGMLGKLVFD